MNKTRGRPRGNPPTRARIVETAHELFLRDGYRGATVRAIAAAAGVDSALIGYHFGSKQGLFAEAMLLRLSPAVLLGDALDGTLAGLPDRLIRAVLRLWDDPDHSGPLGQLIRLALTDDEVQRAFREYTEREVHGRIAEFLGHYLGGRVARERAAAASAVIGGLIFTRYLIPLPAIAALSPAAVRRVFGPPLQTALLGPAGSSVARSRSARRSSAPSP